MLQGYRNRQTIVKGFEYGFRLRFEGQDSALHSKNSQSALEHPHVIEKYIDKELELGRIGGPFKELPFENFKCSPLAVREKGNSGKFRILHNLSFPYDNRSVNFNITKESKTVSYENISNAVEFVNECNGSAWLAKSDLADAFYILPIHPDCYRLTGFKWNDYYYYYKVLPMGCSSSCAIFSEFSDSIKWLLQQRLDNARVVKVLDDFLFVGDSKENCDEQLNIFKNICSQINLPLAHHKTVSPCQEIEFLGIVLNTVEMVAKLPTDKISRYGDAINSCLCERKITLTDLKSLIGKLQFATSVVRGGQAFLRRLYDLTINVKHGHYKVNLNNSVKQDLQIWSTFLKSYNCITIIRASATLASHNLNLYSDASLTGFGATFNNCYVKGIFPKSWGQYSITVLETYPVLAVIGTFAKKLKNKRLVFHCDNMGVVYILNKQSSRNPVIMTMLRLLVLILLENNINLIAEHIPGKTNITCDLLSRQQETADYLAKQGFNKEPTPIPEHLQPHSLKVSELP